MAATTAAADAAAARAAALQKLSMRSAKRKEDQEALRKKLMLKLYLEGLKTKLKAKGREPVKEAPAETPPQQSQHSQEELTIRGDGTREAARACADVLRRHGCACLQTSLDSAKIERCRVLCEEALETTLKDADERGLDRTGLKTKAVSYTHLTLPTKA